MIRGPVVDPRLTLEKADIAQRHLRAFLLQRYHEARIQISILTRTLTCFPSSGTFTIFGLGRGCSIVKILGPGSPRTEMSSGRREIGGFPVS